MERGLLKKLKRSHRKINSDCQTSADYIAALSSAWFFPFSAEISNHGAELISPRKLPFGHGDSKGEFKFFKLMSSLDEHRSGLTG